ncbi:hypothetical protein JFQ88_004122 [Aeromonas dhakensis]|nr:hypothetical protein [Aeromonas dhakensis]
MAKTLGEIIEAARSGERPDYDDLRYAICAMDHLMVFDRVALDRMAEAEREGKKPFMTRSAVWQQKERFERVARALDKTPLEFLGDNWNPDNPEVQEQRQRTIKLVGKIMAKSAGGAE